MSREIQSKVSKFSDLEDLFLLLETYQKNNSLEDQIYYDLKLCIEELILNTLNYGYTDLDRDPVVEIKVSLKNEAVVVEIEDNAKHFNLLNTQHEADIMSELEDRTIGGMGIHLVKNLVDALEYAPLKEGNRIVLEKMI